jgi:hypothetical protein
LQRPSSSSAGTFAAPLAALGGLVAASACCLPVGTMFLAAGSAGAAAFLRDLRPYLMVLSVALICFGFWQASRAKCCGSKPSYAGQALLWIAAFFVGLSLLFPQAFADLLAG